MRERWEQLSPEEKERFRERRERLAKEGRGRRGPEGRERAPERTKRKRAEAGPERGAKAKGMDIPPRFKQWLKNMPAERRKQVLTRLKNASPEDRQRFVKRFAGERGPMEGRRGFQQRRGGGREAGPSGRCPHCGAGLDRARMSAKRGGRGAQRYGQQQRGQRHGRGGDMSMRRRAYQRQMMRGRDFGGPRGMRAGPQRGMRDGPRRGMRGRGFGPGPERGFERGRGYGPGPERGHERPMPWRYRR
jgi:ATP-dependent RNA helicase RhlE